MKITDLLKAAEDNLSSLESERSEVATKQDALLGEVEDQKRSNLTEEEDKSFADLSTQKRELDSKITEARAKVEELRTEVKADEEFVRTQSTKVETRTAPAYDDVARVGQEKRTYNPESDKDGRGFLLDVARQFSRNDIGAADRLNRHMREEMVERGDKLTERAAGTGAFSGLVVPQYLVDLFAPAAKAGRPFADVCRHHDLPETGMTASIGKVTTATTTAEQATENTNVSETDIDDTLVNVPIKTNAGQQTLSRQAIERGVGTDDVTLEDLLRSYNTTLDGRLLNTAVTGLSAVATSIAYTDATPTAAELYPKLLQAPAAVEALLMDQDPGDTIAIMHSRRWYWLQSQLTSTWPMFGQPGIPTQNGGVAGAEKYGSGFRGTLPSGAPVIVDNNVPTNLGAGTNEDEIYFGARSEFHLWEDPNAPVFIRADQTKAASLGVLLVVYGYFAFLHDRRTHAQKIAGTGLITPTFA